MRADMPTGTPTTNEQAGVPCVDCSKMALRQLREATKVPGLVPWGPTQALGMQQLVMSCREVAGGQLGASQVESELEPLVRPDPHG